MKISRTLRSTARAAVIGAGTLGACSLVMAPIAADAQFRGGGGFHGGGFGFRGGGFGFRGGGFRR